MTSSPTASTRQTRRDGNAVSLADVLTAIVVVAALVGLLVAAIRMEPHWVSRDGRRFICKAQTLDHHGHTTSRWMEYRFFITDDGDVEGRRRSMVGVRRRDHWRVRYRATEAPSRKAAFLLDPRDEGGTLLAIRLPKSSRAVPLLDDLTDR